MEIFKMPKEKVETRWITSENLNGEKGEGGKTFFGRKGSPCKMINPGETMILGNINGCGTITRIWITLGGRGVSILRGMKIEMYWDGAVTPAVSAPFGDFFCHSMGQMCTFENEYFSSPEGRSFVCIIPMPFRNSARVEIINESSHGNIIYYEIDYLINQNHSDEVLYFHSAFNRVNMTKPREDFSILPKINGKGRFLGVNVGVRLHPLMTDFWWGEGEMKIYVDGDKKYPTLCGTGTEDYVGTGWGQEKFIQRYTGCHFLSPGKDLIGFYRFHTPDPVYFHQDIKVDIQVMGGVYYGKMLEIMDKDPTITFMKAGDGSEYFTREELEAEFYKILVIERTDDYCATSYWYLDSAERAAPSIPEMLFRIKDLPDISPSDGLAQQPESGV